MNNTERRRFPGAENLLIQSPVVSSTTSTSDHLYFLRHGSLFPILNSQVFPRISARPPIRRTYNSSVHINQAVNNLNHMAVADEAFVSNERDTQMSTKSAGIGITLIFICALTALFFVYTSFPALQEDEKPHVKVPMNLDEAKKLSIVLDKYKNDHYYEVLSGICVTYIFLQTFAIPGSLFLSILSGFLFSFGVALTLICTCSALGASLCYLISQLLGRRIVLRYFPERADKWRLMVKKHSDNIFNYVLFLRITPFLPNWFINLTAPVIGVPLAPFAAGTFFGVAPPSFVAIQAGRTIHTLSSTADAFSWTSIVVLVLFACLSVVPVLIKGRLRDKFE